MSDRIAPDLKLYPRLVPEAGDDIRRVVRTLVLTDLVGSTNLVEALGDSEAAHLFCQMDRATRDLIRQYGGREIDRADGFLLLFERPLAAILFTLDVHRALRALSQSTGHRLEVRAGIHLGEVLLRRNTPADVEQGAKPLEVEGLAKPQAARLMSMARGGQTLLTRVAQEVAKRAAVGESCEATLRWNSHGYYHLAGLSATVEVCEVVHTDYPGFSTPRETGKVRKARFRVPAVVWAGTLLALFTIALGTANWLTATSGPHFATASYTPAISDDLQVQRSFENAIFFMLEDEPKAAADALLPLLDRSDLPVQAYTLYLVATLHGGRKLPLDRIETALARYGESDQPDRWLLGFLERWRIEGWDRRKIIQEVHAHLERHPDHLAGHITAFNVDMRERREIHSHHHAEAIGNTENPPVLRYTMALFGMGMTGRLVELKSLVDEATQQHPDSKKLLFLKAELDLRLGDPMVLVGPLREVLQQDPSNLDGRVLYARALIRTGNAEEAAKQQALLDTEIVPLEQRVAFLMSLASSATASGQRSQALALGLEAIERARTLGDAELLVLTWEDILLGQLLLAVPDGDLLSPIIERMRRDLQTLSYDPVLGKRIRDNLLELDIILAQLRGEHGRAEELLARYLTLDPVHRFGAGEMLYEYTDIDERIAEIEAYGACRDRLFVGHFWFAGGKPLHAAKAIQSGFHDGCPTLDEPVLKPLTHSHLAVISLERRDLASARLHATRFLEIWPNADAELPAVRDVERVLAEVGRR